MAELYVKYEDGVPMRYVYGEKWQVMAMAMDAGYDTPEEARAAWEQEQSEREFAAEQIISEKETGGIMRLIEVEALLREELNSVAELRRALLPEEEDEAEAAIEYAQSVLRQVREERGI